MSLDIRPPAGPPSAMATAATYAGRTVRQFIRTPQLLVVNSVTSVMFLLIFRYVFGGAIQTGPVEYVNFLIPALLAVAGLFSSGVVGTAEDAESGLFDRLRSLPIPRTAVLLGRSLADTALVGWGMFVTLIVGFLVGFRPSGTAAEFLAALVLCIVYGAALSWMMMFLGLISGGYVKFTFFPIAGLCQS